MGRSRILKIVAVAAVAIGGLSLMTQAGATTKSYCGFVWGSLPKDGGPVDSTPSPLTNIRAGRHACYDRIVFDIAGPAPGYHVEYKTVEAQGSGDPIALRGGASIEIVLRGPAYDANGNPTYTFTNPSELVNVSGWQTFRQVAWGGSFEGYTTIGLGVRARLPMRVFVLAGPGSGYRVVVDVAHFW
jgi:hypothetical protein